MATAGGVPVDQSAPQAGLWYPPAKIDNNYFVADGYSGLNFYQLVAPTSQPIIQATSGYNYTPGLTPIQAIAIDSKLDDGQPLTGAVTANGRDGSTQYYGWPGSASDGCSTAAPAQYNMATPDVAKCSLIFRFN